MSIDHHELRLAFGRFLEAKRALRRAYREYGVSQCPSESLPMLEREAADRVRNDSVLSEEMLELKEEIERLRKSLALLHTYCLRIQEQRDTLLVDRDKLLNACQAVATWMRDDDLRESGSA